MLGCLAFAFFDLSIQWGEIPGIWDGTDFGLFAFGITGNRSYFKNYPWQQNVVANRKFKENRKKNREATF